MTCWMLLWVTAMICCCLLVKNFASGKFIAVTVYSYLLCLKRVENEIVEHWI